MVRSLTKGGNGRDPLFGCRPKAAKVKREKLMGLSITNKIGIGLLLVGCCLLPGLDWLGPIAILVGVALFILGFFLTIRNKNSSYPKEDSTGIGGKLHDDD